MNASRDTASPQSIKRDIKLKARTLTDDAGELVELYYKLGIVTITEKASNAASVTITAIVLLFLLMFMLFFAGFGLGWWLGEKIGNMFAGFTIIAGIYMLLIVATIALRKNYLFPFIRNTIIKRIYE